MPEPEDDAALYVLVYGAIAVLLLVGMCAYLERSEAPSDPPPTDAALLSQVGAAIRDDGYLCERVLEAGVIDREDGVEVHARCPERTYRVRLPESGMGWVEPME